MHAACRDGDWNRADALEAELWQFVGVIETRDYLEPYNLIARNKALVNASGWLQAGACRAPLISVPDHLVQRLREDLQPFAQWLAPAERIAVK